VAARPQQQAAATAAAQWQRRSGDKLIGRGARWREKKAAVLLVVLARCKGGA
jgi:hypothetical protein